MQAKYTLPEILSVLKEGFGGDHGEGMEMWAEYAAASLKAEVPVLALDTYNLEKDGENFKALLEKVKTMPGADTPEREAWYAAKFNWVHEDLKATELERKALQEPILRDQRTINAAYKKKSEPGEALKAALAAKLTEAEDARQAALATQLEALAATVATEDEAAVQDALDLLGTDDKVKGISSRGKWNFTVVSLADVPREFLVVDEKAIRAYLKDHKDAPEIPGIQFTRETKVQPTGARSK